MRFETPMTKAALFSIALGGSALGGSACNGDGGTDDTDPGTAESTVLLFLDDNNYSFTAALTLESTEVQAGADILVDWSGIDTDYRGRPFDPADVDQVTVAAIGLPQSTILTKINENGLTQADVGDYRLLATTGQTSVLFSELSVIGAYFDPETEFLEDESFSWLVTLWKLNDLGTMEILSSQFVVPLDSSSTLTLDWSNDVAVLDFDADLSSAPPITTPADASPYSLNWTAVSTDVNGAEFSDLLADTLRIAHLPFEDLAEVEEAFLKLDIASDQTYYLDVYADQSVDDLAEAKAIDGTPFPGFSTGGTWLVGIECTDLSCFSPAPLILAVVEVE